MIATEVQEKAPPGWEPAVKKMKGNPEIDNPFALAWWMADQGYNPGGSKQKEVEGSFIQAWQEFKGHADFKTYMGKHPATESAGTSSLGQLVRPTQKDVTESHKINFKIRLREAGMPNNNDREVPVVIIEEGLGNKVDRHFYTKEALTQGTPMFNGAKCYADHPSRSEEISRPERSVRDVIGYFHEAGYFEKDGVGQIRAILKINQGDSFKWAWDMLTEAIGYSRKFPEQDYIGISINADGVGRAGQDDVGNEVNFIDSFTHVVSADLVTQPAAGGKPLASLTEAVKGLLESRAGNGGGPMEAVLKAAEALRAALAKNKEDEAMYGPAMDEILGQLKKKPEGEAEAKKEGEMAPPPAKDGQLAPAHAEPDGDEPKVAESEDEVYAAEAERYRIGKMTPSETKLFEALTEKRAALALIESEKMVTRKLAESGLPAQVVGDLHLILRSKDEKFVDQMIAARKQLMESITGNRASGAGQKGGAESPSKLKESLVSAGVPLKSK